MIRLLVGSLVFTGTMVSYMLRVSLNIAIVTMTDIDGDNTTSSYCSQNATDDDQRYVFISRIPYFLLRIHHVFSPIYFTNFSHEIFSVSAVEKDNKLLIGPKQFFYSQFAS